MAKGGGKNFKSKPAGAFAVHPGGSGKMKKFGGVVAQKPGVTATTQGSGKGASFPEGGPSGKMHKFSGVKPQKPNRTSQS